MIPLGTTKNTLGASGAARPALALATALLAGFRHQLAVPTLTGVARNWPTALFAAYWVALGAPILHSVWGYAAPRIRGFLLERRIDARIRDQLVALAKEFVETMNPSFTRGAGNMLNLLSRMGTIETEYYIECKCHLRSLGKAASWVTKDLRLRRLRANIGVTRLIGVHADYVRLCIQLADAVSSTNEPYSYRQWDDIRDHANALGNRLRQLTGETDVAKGIDVPLRCVESVPRAFP